MTLRDSTFLEVLLENLDEDDRTDALRALLRGSDTSELADIAPWEIVTPAVLRDLAQHKHAAVRAAVLLNAYCPPDTIDLLTQDKAKSVSELAHAKALWVRLLDGSDETPAHSPGLSRQLRNLLTDNWTAGLGSENAGEAMARILRSQEWRADKAFVRWCYDEVVLASDSLAQALGTDVLLAVVLSAERDDAYRYALRIAAEAADNGQDLLGAIRANEETLRRAMTRTLPQGWEEDTELIVGDIPTPSWGRLGFADCPDAVLLAALATHHELLVVLAGAAVRERENLQDDVSTLLNAEWEAGNPRWDLVGALDDDHLECIPLGMLDEPAYTDSGVGEVERASKALARRAFAIAEARPEAWDVLKMLSPSHEGTVGELLSAARTL